MDLYKSIQNRVSVRKYSDKLFSETSIKQIQEKLKNLIPLYQNIKVRLELVSDPGTTSTLLTGFVGSYGKINSPYCIIAVTEETPGHMENLGFLQEQIVLELTDMGIGTCWVAGNFDRNKAGKVIDLKAGEMIIDVIALGYAQESFYNNGFRKILGSHKRKPRNEISFDSTWGKDVEEFLKNNPKMSRMLDASVLSPSAGNKQHARAVLSEKQAVFFAYRSKGIYKNAPMIDTGIFMSHFYLAAVKEGMKPEFVKETDAAAKYGVPEDFDYVASMKLG